MGTLARALLLASFLVTAACAQGCLRSCAEHLQTYTLEDAELARVTEGTGSPTAAGCDVVCEDRKLTRDAGNPDGGLRVTDEHVVGCTLSGRQLTCDFGVLCAL